MIAVRVRSHDGRTHSTHWLADAEWTECGRKLIHLRVVDNLELESLGGEGCDVCEELRFRNRRPKRPSSGYYLTPSYGRLYTEGPLSGTARSKRGGRHLGPQ